MKKLLVEKNFGEETCDGCSGQMSQFQTFNIYCGVFKTVLARNREGNYVRCTKCKESEVKNEGNS